LTVAPVDCRTCLPTLDHAAGRCRAHLEPGVRDELAPFQGVVDRRPAESVRSTGCRRHGFCRRHRVGHTLPLRLAAPASHRHRAGLAVGKVMVVRAAHAARGWRRDTVRARHRDATRQRAGRRRLLPGARRPVPEPGPATDSAGTRVRRSIGWSAPRRAAPRGVGVGGHDRGGRRRWCRSCGCTPCSGRPGRPPRCRAGASGGWCRGTQPLPPDGWPGCQPDAGQLSQERRRGPGQDRAGRGGVEAGRHPGPDPQAWQRHSRPDQVPGRHHRSCSRGRRADFLIAGGECDLRRRADRAALGRSAKTVSGDRFSCRQPRRSQGGQRADSAHGIPV